MATFKINSKILFSNRYIRPSLPWILVLFGAAIAVGAYLQALNYPFVSDDIPYITHNTKLSELPLTQLWRLFVEPFNMYSEFLPLRELSYRLDMALFGINAPAFRLENILLYLLCLPLVYCMTSWLWDYFHPEDKLNARWIAAAVTVLFVLHPSHAEAVVWISGRKDVLSTLLSLLALWFSILARREQGLAMPYAVAALVALLAAILSKASSVAVAPVIAMIWLMFWRDVPAQARRYSVLLWPLASIVLAGGMAMIFAGFTTQRVPFYFGVEVITRTLAILGWLGRLAVSPESRHICYPVLDDPYMPGMVILGLLILIATLAGAVTLLRKRSLEGFALVSFLLLCLPSLQLIPYSPPSLASDRWIALACWPVLLLTVSLAWRLKPWPRITLLLVFVLSFAFQTINRASDWSSEDHLWDVDMRAYPGYYVPTYIKITLQPLGGPASYDRVLKMAESISDPDAKRITIALINSDRAVFGTDSQGDPRDAIASLKYVESLLGHPPAKIKWDAAMQNFWRDSQSKLTNLWQHLVSSFPNNPSVHYGAATSRRYQIGDE
jgi:hypothetical protein